MAAEEVTEAQLPFGMGSIDFGSPKMAAFAIVSLVLGFAVFGIARDFGDTVASRIQNKISQVTGVSASGGGSTTAPGVI